MPPRLARLVAVIAAIALLGGAFVLRGALAGDDGETVASGPGQDDDGGDPPPDGYRVICDKDLGDAACNAIKALDGVDADAFTTSSASTAVEAMSAEVAPYDAWVALDPWPQILDEARSVAALAPVADGEAVPLASSELALLTYESGGVDCAGQETWPCLADAAAGSDIGLPDLGSAAGPLALGAAAASLLGSDFGIRDAQEGDARLQLKALLDSGDPGTLAQQATEMVTQRGRFDGLVTTQGLGTSTSENPQGEQAGLAVVALTPETTLGVALAPIGPNGAEAVDQLKDQVTGEPVTEALAEAGWTRDPQRSQGLPDPDLLYALNEEFA